MSPHPLACSYLLGDGESRCSRSPVVVDVFAEDEVIGSTWLASLCAHHWTVRKQAFALSRGYSWVEREATGPTLEVVAG